MRSVSRWLLAALVAVLAASSHAQRQGSKAAAGSPPAVAPAPVEVRMTNALQFAPVALTVTQGESIVWVNATQMTHTVTADPGKAQIPAHAQLPAGAAPFDSGNIGPGGQFRHTFDVPGTYRYFCKQHELAGMVATVIVEPTPGAQQPR
jgi:plastocyanin